MYIDFPYRVWKNSIIMTLPNIEDILGFEIKKEMADRYFGFRKLIEEDKLDLSEQIKHYSFILERRISYDLIRIYILLKDEDLIVGFLNLSGLEKNLFYDPYLIESPTIRKRVFEGVHLRGITWRGCFKNMVLDCYERLVDHVTRYRKRYQELMESQETINEEIKIFYRQNDLTSIMGFLRSLGGENVSGMEGGMEIGMATSLDDKMRIDPTLPIEQFLPAIPPLTPLSDIKNQLKKLVNKAFQQHGKNYCRDFVSNNLRTWF